MNEHEQVIGIRAKNSTPIELDSRRTALIVVDMQRYFTQPSFPFTEVFERLSPGASARAGDYRAQTHRIWRTARFPSHLVRPVLPN